MIADWSSPQFLAFVVGAFLVASGVLGGGIEIREVKIPKLETVTRLLAVAVGAAFIGIGLGAIDVGVRTPKQPPANDAATRPAAPNESTKVFTNPTVNGYRLDWCLNWAADCGGPAAAAWCAGQGYARAETFVQDPFVQERGIVTKVYATGDLCHGPRCDSFVTITCAK